MAGVVVTTRVVRRSSRIVVPLHFLPAVVLVVLGVVAVLLAQIAPGRVTVGVYQVVVGEGADEVVIAAESLSCGRSGEYVTCVAPVGSARLAVTLEYRGVVEPGLCFAWYANRPVSCARVMGDYGYSSHTVWIRDGLDLSAPQRDALRAEVPWWRGDLTAGGLVLVSALGISMGVTTLLVRPRGRAVPLGRRRLVLVFTAVLGAGFFAVSALVISGEPFSVLWAVLPSSLLAAAVLTVWQYELSGPPPRGRVGSAVVAASATVLYCGIALFVFGLQGAFVD